jgi:hypothetical protein
MSPGGHLVTTVAACAASLVMTRDVPAGDAIALVAGIAAGGFLIDVDHAIDYVLFDGQRDLRPGVFLRHYLDGRAKRIVLALHSFELFALLGVMAVWLDALPLWGYLMGALMHLSLDIVFNAEFLSRSPILVYSFVYRWAHGFDARAFQRSPDEFVTPAGFWPAFFAGARAVDEPGRELSTADASPRAGRRTPPPATASVR